jgi:Sec-independent protein secretion pathway component TatC
MFVPIVVFYELGILVAWMFGKKKKEEEEKENTEDETFN